MNDKLEKIVRALELLGLNGDKIFERIQFDLHRGLVEEARSHLNFVDVMLKLIDGQTPC